MLFDLHCHTSGISRCCKLPYNEILDIAKNNGYDGLVITNHYTEFELNDYGESLFVEKYIEEYRLCKEYGEKIGLKVLFGVEVTAGYNQAVHLLIYGVTPEFLRENPNLPSLSQKELYEICHKNDCVLINAHPFRYGQTVQDLNYLDGVEINCHLGYGNCFYKKLSKIAYENKVAVTCGCDYHGGERPLGGTYLPDDVTNNVALVDYLKNSNEFLLKVHAPETREIFNLKVVRG